MRLVSAPSRRSLLRGLVTHLPLLDGRGGVARNLITRGRATLSGGAVWRPQPGWRCLRHNGTDSYLRGDKILNLPQRTLALWIRLTSIQANKYIAGFQNSLNDATHDGSLYLDASGLLRWYVFDGATKTTSAPAAALPVNRWVLVAGTIDGATAIVWTNAVTVGSVACGNGFAGYTAANLFVGGRSNTPDSGGYLAFDARDVRVWNRALTAAEMAALYKAGPDEAPSRRLIILPSNSSIILAGDGATVPSTAGTGAATQTQILTGSPADASGTAGTHALSQTQVLGGAPADAAGTAGASPLAQTQLLAGTPANAASTAGTGALTSGGLGLVRNPYAVRVTPIRAALRVASLH